MKTQKKIMAFVLMLALMLSIIPVVEQVSAASKPAKPKITVAVSEDGASATISIGKTKRAKGFQIVAKLPGTKKFTELTTLELDGTKKRSFTLENIPDGNYTVKVRAYTVKNGKKVWGKYSKTKAVTIKSAIQYDYFGIEQGDIVQFGSYEQDNNKGNGKEPLSWVVLTKDKGKLFLVSLYALEAGTVLDGVGDPYGEEDDYDEDDDGGYDYDDPYEWKDSFVRSWLNGAFINKAFSADELAIIDDTKLEEEACVDKVFLLSKDEVLNQNYALAKTEDRSCIPTKYSLNYGDGGYGIDMYGGGCYWWLRTEDKSKERYYYLVAGNGKIISHNGIGLDLEVGYSHEYDDDDEEDGTVYIEDGAFGIRPALVVNLTGDAKDLIVKTGKSTKDKKWNDMTTDYTSTDSNPDSGYDPDSIWEILIPEREVKEISEAEQGDLVLFGSYEQDNNSKNGKEAIEWIVLSRSDNELMLLSRYGLDCKAYNDAEAKNSWESCKLREWLNDTFYNEAFSQDEMKKVKAQKLKNMAGNKVQKETEDKVFILSAEDTINPEYGFNADKDKKDPLRACVPTKYATKQGLYIDDEIWTTDEDDLCNWWLRNLDESKKYAYVIGEFGYLSEDYGVSIDELAARPAIVISLK